MKYLPWLICSSDIKGFSGIAGSTFLSFTQERDNIKKDKSNMIFIL